MIRADHIIIENIITLVLIKLIFIYKNELTIKQINICLRKTKIKI
jgi:hypothetical protein